jgi:post-segregation antitoxin (ccd killing protein)
MNSPGARRECIVRRMPRMQVYLPDDLYAEVKAQELPASELLQQAVRAELRRRALLEETDRYIEELVAEVGAPSARDLAAAEELVARLGLSKTAAVTR